MSTNLSGNTLTLNNTSLNESYIKEINKRFYIPNNCKAGDTVILDGIECLCVATGVTIQGSNLTRIAVDKNHDLGYYQKYVGMTQNRIDTNQIKYWRWGGTGTALGNTSQEVGYGLQNTIRCLANTVVYTNGTNTNTSGDGYPWLWRGVSDFRSSHSDKWFVPSAKELKEYVYPYRSNLSYDVTTGTGPAEDMYIYWSSSEKDNNNSYRVYFNGGYLNDYYKRGNYAVRLCRAF